MWSEERLPMISPTIWEKLSGSLIHWRVFLTGCFSSHFFMSAANAVPVLYLGFVSS